MAIGRTPPFGFVRAISVEDVSSWRTVSGS